MPRACESDPLGAPCVNAAIYYLDQARARLGQPAYALPADFVALLGDRQILILSNLDRALYGLPLVAGVNATFDADAAAGAEAGADPDASDSAVRGATSNWAGGSPNLSAAYDQWMYNDGVGSGNLDCAAAGAAGCWGHRHDVLWDFNSGSGDRSVPSPSAPQSRATAHRPRLRC
jgi:hypothetical protein